MNINGKKKIGSTLIKGKLKLIFFFDVVILLLKNSKTKHQTTEMTEVHITYKKKCTQDDMLKSYSIAIRVATKWYKDHLKTNGDGNIEMVLLTDDRGNREKASATGIVSSGGIVLILEILEKR